MNQRRKTSERITSNLKISEFDPVDILKPYIKKMSIYSLTEASTYKILPDTALVIGFQYSGSLNMEDQNEVVSLASNGITGLLNQYRIFTNTPNTSTILVYFTEVGAYNFLSFPVNELNNISVALDTIIKPSKIKEVEEKIQLVNTDLERIAIIECFIISEINFGAMDSVISLAIDIIKKSMGDVKISEIAKALFISESTLERRFKTIVGTTPKKFAEIIKLRAIIDDMAQNNHVQAFLYFDQSHFIHTFKKLTGTTPNAYKKQISNAK